MLVCDLAKAIDAIWEGDGQLDISSAAALDQAGPTDLSFVSASKFAAAASSRAGCLVVPNGFPAGVTLIRAREPRLAFARLIPLLHPLSPAESGIHPTAVVHPSAQLASSVSVGPHCFVGSNVQIGADTVLHANVSVYEDTRIGTRCVVHSGAVLGADGFGFVRTQEGYQKFPQIGFVIIGDDVEIGANTCIDRAALGQTTIGDGVKLDNLVHIGHNCSIGNRVVIAAQTGISGGVVVEDDAVIGGQVGIGDKARIEARAVLGSGSGVLTSKVVRGGQVMWGTPARPLKEHLTQLAHLARLPELRKELNDLKRKIEELGR